MMSGNMEFYGSEATILTEVKVHICIISLDSELGKKKKYM